MNEETTERRPHEQGHEPGPNAEPDPDSPPHSEPSSEGPAPDAEDETPEAFPEAEADPAGQEAGTSPESPEEPAPEAEEDEISVLHAQLQEKDEQIQDLMARLQRLKADFDNYKKRVARERQEEIRRVENELLLDVLPVYDGFDRAFRDYEANQDKDAFIEGMERIFNQFHDVLGSQGVEPIEAEGEPFDPSRHEALMSVESAEHPPNTVLEAFERGYRRGEDLLRPSRVKVSRKPAPPPEADASASAEETGQTADEAAEGEAPDEMDDGSTEPSKDTQGGST